jgi:hypothetical protein
MTLSQSNMLKKKLMATKKKRSSVLWKLKAENLD